MEFGTANYDALNSKQKAVLRQRLQDTVRKNNYDAASDKLTVEPIRAAAFEEIIKHYSEIFTNVIKINDEKNAGKLHLCF